MVDTHTHLYVQEFENDRAKVVARALDAGVTKMLLPNIDSGTIEAMNRLQTGYPEHLYPMMGLHPTSVNNHFEKELSIVREQLETKKYYGVGEIGIDLFWDKTFEEQQNEAFRHQLQLAKKYRLPVSIHTRNAFDIALNIVKEELTDDLKGVFHCFTGTKEEAFQIMDVGFKMGIGGIVTFKNSGLGSVLKTVELHHLVLETDAPWLTPVPYRGKRNESGYLVYIAKHLAEIKGVAFEEVAEVTTLNATTLFHI